MTGAFGRLFTAYLQMRGFTCGMDDLLVQQPAEADRLRVLKQTETTALQASSKAVGDKHYESVRPLLAVGKTLTHICFHIRRVLPSSPAATARAACKHCDRLPACHLLC